MSFSGFCLLHDGRPADPFIPCEGRKVVPLFKKLRIGRENLSKICRDGVDYAGGDCSFGHECVGA